MLKLLLNKKSEDVSEIILEKQNETDAETEESCENFAYRKNLIFYRTECKYCRYAKMIKENGVPTGDYVCTYVTDSVFSGKDVG